MPDPQIKDQLMSPVPAMTHTGRVFLSWGLAMGSAGTLSGIIALISETAGLFDNLLFNLLFLMILFPIYFLIGGVFGGLIARAGFSWAIKDFLQRHPTKPTGWLGIWSHDYCIPLFQRMFALDTDGSMKR
jgi:hypothetical protein